MKMDPLDRLDRLDRLEAHLITIRRILYVLLALSFATVLFLYWLPNP